MPAIDIPQDVLNKLGIKDDPSPEQLKAIFAQLAEKGLLDKPGTSSKKSSKSSKKEVKGTGSHQGLVLRDVTVKRGGKTFKQKRWVKAGEDEPEVKGKKVDDEKGGKQLGKFNIGDSVTIKGKKLTIDKVSTEHDTIKLSDGKVYTHEAIKSFDKKSEKKSSVKKPDVKVSIKPEPKVNVKGKKDIGIKLTDDNKDDVLKVGNWINIDGESVGIVDNDNMFITTRNAKGVDEVNSIFSLILDKDVKSEKSKSIPEKLKKVAIPKTKSDKVVKGKMIPSDVESIKSLKDMGVEGGINESTTNIINFNDGSKSIYKTGNVIDIQGETNVQEIQKILGWDIAPETVVDDFGSGIGSSQRFVDDSKGTSEIVIDDTNLDDLSKIYLMDMITGNYDRHYNNARIGKDGRFWAIDNDTWGNKSNYNVDSIYKSSGGTMMEFWMGLDDDKKYQFQTHVNHNIGTIIKNKSKVTKYINSLNKKDSEFKPGYNEQIKEKGDIMDEYNKPRSIKEATGNMIENLTKVVNFRG